MGSKLFPNVWNGKQSSGGYVAKNPYRQQNAKAPDAKGRVYVVSPGWHWIAIWNRKKPDGSPYGSIVLTGMSDEDAKKYCAKEAPPQQSAEPPPDDSDVPF